MKNKRGEMYIDAVIIALICIITLFISIGTFKLFYTYSKVDNLTTQVAHYAEMNGEVNTEDFNKYVEDAANEYGLNKENLTVSTSDSTFIKGSETKIQYGDSINIVVDYTGRLSFVNSKGFIDIPIQTKKVVISQAYHK